MSQIRNAVRAQMFQVMDGEAIRSDSSRVAAVPNGLCDEMKGER